jgi:phospholipid transport system transporter-binding protein
VPRKFEQSAPTINIDLQQLGKIDSAGLALLIEWIKFAQTSQTKLRFTALNNNVIPGRGEDFDIAHWFIYRHPLN